MFVKFDIKHFYMSGDHSSLVKRCSELIDDPRLRLAFEMVVKVVLDSKDISVPGVDDFIWKVMKGSGMGLLCSGELSEAAFLSMAERRFVSYANIRGKFSVEYYGRFKDDGILVIGGTTVHACGSFRS